VSPSPTDGKFDIALLDAEDLNNPSAPISFRTGQVDGAQLATVSKTDVPVSYQVVDPENELAFDRGGLAWLGDDFFWVGKAKSPCIALFWMDAFGPLRTRMVGSNAILTDRPNLEFVTVTLGEKVGALSATIDVVWAEKVQEVDGGGGGP